MLKSSLLKQERGKNEYNFNDFTYQFVNSRP